MIEVTCKNKRDKVRTARRILKMAENQIGNVWFIKRSDGKKRRMSYRLKVTKPTYATIPTGKGRIDPKEHNLMTVFDCNLVRYNSRGKINGRGDYRSIPLDNVIRISVNGQIYRFVD